MKTCLRESCKKEFEPNKPKQKFCSDKCRVYYSREKLKNPTPPEKEDPLWEEFKKWKMGAGAEKKDMPIEEPNLPKNDAEPKWKLKNPIMRVPLGLKGIARDAWIAEFKKANRIDNK